MTWQCDNRCASPQDVHAGSVSVTQRSVQTDVGQLSAPHVLLLGGHVAEQQSAGRQTQLLCCVLQVLFTYRGEPQQPQHCVGHVLQDLWTQSLLQCW